jgi:hypothetical protein
MIAADPLTPTVQLEVSVSFVVREVRVTHKPELGLMASVGQSLG